MRVCYVYICMRVDSCALENELSRIYVIGRVAYDGGVDAQRSLTLCFDCLWCCGCAAVDSG